MAPVYILLGQNKTSTWLCFEERRACGSEDRRGGGDGDGDGGTSVQRYLQASPGEEAEVAVGFLPGLEPSFRHRVHISGTRLDFFGLTGFFALLTPMLKQIAMA